MSDQRISITCPACSKRLTAERRWIGRSVPCPSCGESVTIAEVDSPLFEEEYDLAAVDHQALGRFDRLRSNASLVASVLIWGCFGLAALTILLAVTFLRVTGPSTFPLVLIVALSYIFLISIIGAIGYGLAILVRISEQIEAIK